MLVNGVATAAARSIGAGSMQPAPVDQRAGGDTATAADAELSAPYELEVLGTDPEQLQAIAQVVGSGSAQVVPRVVQPDAERELAHIGDEVDLSRTNRLTDLRDSLRQELREHPENARKLTRQLHQVEDLLRLQRREDEKRLAIKRIMRMLVMGILTPEVIALAKSLGLTKFLKDAIELLVRKGAFSPDQLRAIAGQMAQAGMSMPMLDFMVARHDRLRMQSEGAARAARGLVPPTETGGRQARVASILLAPAVA